MINTIIFSRNKAPQLRLLLESIKINSEDMFDISVIYSSNSECGNRAYEKIKTESLSEGVRFIKMTDFKQNVLSAVDSMSEYVCFFTDDNVLFGNINEKDINEAMSYGQDIFCFSLCLGLNTKYSYASKTDNKLYGQEEFEKFIKWDWTVHYLDYGYPISLDGHIFRTKEMKKFISKVNFDNVETLEEGLQIFNNFPKSKMAAYKNSVAVSIPDNKSILQDVINEKYLNGENIDVKQMDFSNVIGCLQEIEYKYKGQLHIVR